MTTVPRTTTMTSMTCHGRVDEATTATATGTTTGAATAATTTVLEAYFPDDASSFYSEREDAQEDDDELDSDTITSSFFDEMDELEEALYSTSDALAEAVAREDYAEASALKERYAALEGRDTTLAIEEAFSAAIAEERYGDAARLRDEGGVRLLGWWVGREWPEDMAGHLVEVTGGVGRYVGRAWVSEDDGVELIEGGIEGGIDSELFEVFYRPGREGRYLSQATIFDGRVLFGEDDDSDGWGEEEEEEDTEEEEEAEDDGIRTVEDLLNMGEDERERLVEALDEEFEGEDDVDDEEEEDEDEYPEDIEVVRQLAEIEWLDKDRFQLRMEGEVGAAAVNEMAELERAVMGVVGGGGVETLEAAAGAAEVADATTATATATTTATADEAVSKPMISINYRRLGDGEKDELYLGSFGPHGQEVVHIYTTTVDGRKMIEGR